MSRCSRRPLAARVFLKIVTPLRELAQASLQPRAGRFGGPVAFFETSQVRPQRGMFFRHSRHRALQLLQVFASLFKSRLLILTRASFSASCAPNDVSDSSSWPRSRFTRSSSSRAEESRVFAR